MAKFQITGPDGGSFEVTAPDGASEKDVLAYAQSQWKQKPAPREPDALDDPNMATSGMGAFQRGAAGAGAQLSDMWDAAKQIVGAGPSSDEVRQKRALNAPLDATPSGKVGRFAGAVIPFAATSMIPGANTYTGAALGSAAMGALEPVTDEESRLKNTAVAGAVGVASKYGVDKVAGALSNRLASEGADLAAQQSRNAVRDATIADAGRAGYVVPPSATNPSFVNRRLESIAGKAAIGQEAAARNQEITNALARKAVGMADDAPISESALESIRSEAGKAYKAVAALDPRAASALERLKDARAESKVQWNFYNRSGTPDALRAAKAADAQASILETVLEKVANKANQPELIDALKDARRLIAKSYDVERALNLGSGDVSAPVIGRMLDKGTPLSEELSTIGRLSQAFPKYAGEGAKIPTPGVSKSEAVTAAILGTLGASAGGPIGALAGAIPLASGPVRSMILSKPYQAAMARAPSYAPGAALTLTEKIANLPPAKAAARAALVEAILANSQ